MVSIFYENGEGSFIRRMQIGDQVFRAQKGHNIVITGPRGSGKSKLLTSIRNSVSQLGPSNGRVLLYLGQERGVEFEATNGPTRIANPKTFFMHAEDVFRLDHVYSYLKAGAAIARADESGDVEILDKVISFARRSVRVLFDESVDLTLDRRTWSALLSYPHGDFIVRESSSGTRAVMSVWTSLFHQALKIIDSSPAPLELITDDAHQVLVNGYVFIDTPELHLHPDDYGFIRNLTGLFPNVQFIYATNLIGLAQHDRASVYYMFHVDHETKPNIEKDGGFVILDYRMCGNGLQIHMENAEGYKVSINKIGLPIARLFNKEHPYDELVHAKPTEWKPGEMDIPDRIAFALKTANDELRRMESTS